MPMPNHCVECDKLVVSGKVLKKELVLVCDKCKEIEDHTDCMGCEEPMCEDEDKKDMPEGWYHPDCHSDIYE